MEINNGDVFLSEETLDSISSFDNTLESEVSCSISHTVPPEYLTNQSISLISSVTTVESPKTDLTGEPNFSSFEDSLCFLRKTLDSAKLDGASVSKLKDLKQKISEVNEAYADCKRSQFVLDCYKKASEHLQQLAPKVNDILSDNAAHQYAHIKNNSGETFNILGLEDDDIETLTSKRLTTFEANQLSKHAMVVMKTNLQKLEEEKKILTDQFGSHSQKVVQSDTVLTEERKRQGELYQHVQHQLDQGCQLINDTNKTMVELLQLQQNPSKEFQCSASVLKDKALYLQTKTSILKLKTQLSACMDTDNVRTMNTIGDNLKASINATGEELKGLKKTLSEYERKEASSMKYKEIVQEYAKLKKQLDHKYQTLSVLNDPDTSLT